MGDSPSLLPQQYERYRRHLSLAGFGLEGQERLLASRILLIGAGGLGCPAAQYLVAAGVGALGVIDDDVVDLSNLQRQVLYGVDDVGRPKADVAAERLRALNPEVEVVPYRLRLSAENALEIFDDYDLVIDGTDNFPTRYLSNDACVLLGKPNVYGSIFRFEGQASVFDATRGPCYRCLFPEPPPPGSVPSCVEGGVLGVLPGIVATIQATEAIKCITGVGEPLVGRLLLYDALEMSFREFRVRKDPACPICGDEPTIARLIDYEGFCGITEVASVPMISASELSERLRSGSETLVLDVREANEVEKASIAGSQWIALGELSDRLGELEAFKDRPIVVHCHLGGRSADATRLLMDRGFGNVKNLDGGIDAWSLTVDPNVPRY